MRVTFVCPEPLCDAANHLFMALGASVDEGRTFGPALWETADRHRFSAASLEVSETWLTAIEAPLSRPAWDSDATVDLEAAEAATARLDILAEAPERPVADRITVIAGLPGWQALSALGLRMIDPEWEA